VGHTIRTCPKLGNSKFAGEKLREGFGLNEAYTPSVQCTPSKSPKDNDHDYIHKVREQLMSTMPNSYVEDKTPKVIINIYVYI